MNYVRSILYVVGYRVRIQSTSIRTVMAHYHYTCYRLPAGYYVVRSVPMFDGQSNFLGSRSNVVRSGQMGRHHPPLLTQIRYTNSLGGVIMHPGLQ